MPSIYSAETTVPRRWGKPDQGTLPAGFLAIDPHEAARLDPAAGRFTVATKDSR
ncbi:hypothetical protein [Streptomyces sp. NPDC049906]|uniref:hypothetical protein n=1 Tax=Streptomyces sp. NPDC049906 TaxID=3155656 RepID=UPI00341E9C76